MVHLCKIAENVASTRQDYQVLSSQNNLKVSFLPRS